MLSSRIAGDSIGFAEARQYVVLLRLRRGAVEAAHNLQSGNHCRSILCSRRAAFDQLEIRHIFLRPLARWNRMVMVRCTRLHLAFPFGLNGLATSPERRDPRQAVADGV